jgi:hypothetical protein
MAIAAERRRNDGMGGTEKRFAWALWVTIRYAARQGKR